MYESTLCFGFNADRTRSTTGLYLCDDGVVLSDPLVLWLLFDCVDGGELHSSAVSTQNSLAPAHVGSLQSEAAAVLAGGQRVVSDVTESCRAAHPLACCPQLPAEEQRAYDDWRVETLRWASGESHFYRRRTDHLYCVYLCIVRKVFVM